MERYNLKGKRLCGGYHFKKVTMKQLYKNILLSVKHEEKNVRQKSKSTIEEAYHMVSFLRKLLSDLKRQIAKSGFATVDEEIAFFKTVKPEILGKLIYYNRLVRLEVISAERYELIQAYYSEQIKLLNKEYKKHLECSDFYWYYRSGRSDKDLSYFRLGNINFLDGVDSFFFEVDLEFSTYYDYKVAQIIAMDYLCSHFLTIINQKDTTYTSVSSTSESGSFSWTDSKNALIELIYALHAAGSVSNGRTGLRKLSKLFEELFEVNLGDIHHAFHQMKFRAGEKTSYLLFLKNSLEQYMDREL